MTIPQKRIILFSCLGVLSVLFWYIVHVWIMGYSLFASYSLMIFLGISFIFLLTLVGLILFLMESIQDIAIVSGTIIIGFLAFFGFRSPYLIAFGTLFLLYIYAGSLIKQEKRQRVSLDIGYSVGRGISGLILPILILISFGYYYTPFVQGSRDNIQIPATIERTVHSFALYFVKNQFNEDSSTRQSAITNQVVRQVIAQFDYIIRPYTRFVPPILAFGLFLVLQGVSFIFAWIALLFASVIFRILKTKKFIKIDHKETTVEAVSL